MFYDSHNRPIGSFASMKACFMANTVVLLLWKHPPIASKNFAKFFNLFGLTFQYSRIRNNFIHHGIIHNSLCSASKSQSAVTFLLMNYCWCDIANNCCLCISSQWRLQNSRQFAISVWYVPSYKHHNCSKDIYDVPRDIQTTLTCTLTCNYSQGQMAKLVLRRCRFL